MLRRLLTRAKSAWHFIIDWLRTRFSSVPAVEPPRAAEPDTAPIVTSHAPIADEPPASEPPPQMLAREAIVTTPARELEGVAKSVDGRMVPWVLVPPERRYRLYVPAGDAEGARAMVMMIHGCRQNAASFAAATRMNRLADQYGFAVLYPDQSDAANLRRCWNWFESQTLLGKGEAAILLSMIDRAAKRANVDLERVAVAGLSSGGALAALLAFMHPARFQSVMVHSGLPPQAAYTLAGAMNAMRDGAGVNVDKLTDHYWRTQQLPPPSLMIVHGDADDQVNPANADTLLELWARVGQAESPDLLMRTSHDVDAVGDVRAHRITRLHARDHTLAQCVRVSGLAHAWSGGDPSQDFTDATGPDVSRMFVEFAAIHQPVAVSAPLA
jgi:poly(hydroxyalkanoate) depolymerase family esterase